MTIFDHLVHDRKEFINFLRSKYRRRLIENEQGCAAVKSFDDFNALLLTHRELPDVGVWINFQTINFGKFYNSFRDAVKICEWTTRGWQSKSHILSDS